MTTEIADTAAFLIKELRKRAHMLRHLVKGSLVIDESISALFDEQCADYIERLWRELQVACRDRDLHRQAAHEADLRTQAAVRSEKSALSAQSETIPTGWRLVPERATILMLEVLAGPSAVGSISFSNYQQWEKQWQEQWERLLAECPATPAEREHYR